MNFVTEGVWKLNEDNYYSTKVQVGVKVDGPSKVESRRSKRWKVDDSGVKWTVFRLKVNCPKKLKMDGPKRLKADGPKSSKWTVQKDWKLTIQENWKRTESVHLKPWPSAYPITEPNTLTIGWVQLYQFQIGPIGTNETVSFNMFWNKYNCFV